MGFITPAPPPVDIEEWKTKPHLERIKPLAQDWAVNGFGTPSAVYLLYIVKLILFVVGGLWLISATPGLGGLGEIAQWWREPIVWQKIVVWLILWELLGLGSGSMPLTFRFLPPIGGILYWLRPGAIRLPPWPDKVPFTRGSRRTIVDVALCAGVVIGALYLLLSPGLPIAGFEAGRLDPYAIGAELILLIALGLRDKVSYLSTRPEIYGLLLVVFLFPIENMVVASQIVLVCVWFGAASSKLNRHFPYVVAVMISNTPWNRSRFMKRKLYRNHPEDLRPSGFAALAAHTGTVIEFLFPLLLLVTQGGTIGTIAVVAMLIFHLHITSTFPLAVPLEWNLFMIFGLFFLFTGTNAAAPFSDLESPLLWAIVLGSGVLIPILGNLRPDLISFLPSMRYYAGNWATSQWLFRKDTGAEEKLEQRLTKTAPIVVNQLTTLYDRDTAELTLSKALAFRALHSHGRALNGLLPRAVDDLESYTVREGEFLAGVILGFNFGDGHFHGRQLLEAVQQQCGFEEGDLRVVTLESQPAHIQRQHYRIFDATTGLIEEGYVNVADMVERHPWLDPSETFPVEVIGGGGGGSAAPPPGRAAP
ncbi:MAG: DUF3556 domain-containing protein, partial [Thermoleophilaceae bacterium]|nr:DUF3556 domain-containing protein [Thermoleophilaceae bacterium]